MRGAMTFVCFVVAVLVISVAGVPISVASGATFTFSNGLDLRMSVTMAYYDANSGALTTRGWWHVEPGGETAVTVNADVSRGVYYAAYNKVLFIDSETRGNTQIRRWASPRTFKYTTNEEPYDDGVWYGRFYKINAQSVNIDARW
jgi:uncharacterized membrane protein